MRTSLLGGLAATVLFSSVALAQEPAAWGTGPDINFHTFSIVAVDPRTGETGVIVTTRNPCVGNAVPWVRAGVRLGSPWLPEPLAEFSARGRQGR